MSASETRTKSAQESVWQTMLNQEGIARKRSLWSLLLCFALLVIGLDLVAEHWLALEGRLALIVKVAGSGAVGLTALLILDKARDLWQQRREAAAAVGGSGS
ncbi:MAG: hypothetical protein F4117_10730 [Acidimicrobiales bacterium]|nr:hypothetical protein [Acidimicrobiales bacterium]MXX44021.1 hypothetical protein [Acidimicrobiales bacterium]MYB80993.1 hypothetical protein [Acidimicrobiales bacterium]MYD33641.1 hypothetical protein [Acidimicrobiales bacterium]MYI10655.1 hypothetical protein [Acidimicrobiales bacterium]